MDYAQELKDYREGKRGMLTHDECQALIDENAAQAKEIARLMEALHNATGVLIQKSEIRRPPLRAA